MMELKVRGMHCPACEAIIEDAIHEIGILPDAKVSLSKRSITANIEPNQNISEIKEAIKMKIEPLGYTIEDGTQRININEYLIGALISVGILGIFIIINLLGPKPDIHEFSPLSALIIGFIASISTCFALVGGVMMSYISGVSSSKPRLAMPALFTFHGSRILTFLIGGLLLGLIGDQLSPDSLINNPLILIAGILMLLIGLQLLGIIPAFSFGTRQKSVTQTKGRGQLFLGIILGAGTILLPCSFTLSVIIEAISSADPINGMLIMGGFVLGTSPILILSGLALGKFMQGKFAAYMRKSSGFLVIGFGIWQIIIYLRNL